MNVRTETSTDPGLRRADVRRARELYRTVAERKRGKIIFLEVGVLLDSLGDGDQACSHALRRAWRAFEQPATDDARHRSLGQVAAKARERIKRLALLFADGDLDREGYDPGRLQAQADLEAAERALAGLADRRPGVALPPLEEAPARLAGWRGALGGGMWPRGSTARGCSSSSPRSSG